MTSQPTVSVVILNWNGQHFLEQYLPKVLAYSQYPGVSIVVADNASTDGSLSFLEKFPEVQTILFDKNYGFAEGYNRALQLLNSDLYVLLNSDVEVTANWLPPLIELMTAPDVAACMPKIRAVASPDYFEYAGAAGGFMDMYGYAFCRGRLFDTLEKDTGQYDTSCEIFWATGACMMVNARIFHKMGGFDGFFFAHMEEIDLCWRMKNAGYHIMYTPKSLVYHVGGGMLPQNNPFKTFLNYRNNLLMMYKNLPARKRLRILITRMLLDGISALYSLLRGDTSVIKAIWKAHIAFWKARPAYRKKLDKTKLPQHYPNGVYHHSIVYQYFIKKKKYYSDFKQD